MWLVLCTSRLTLFPSQRSSITSVEWSPYESSMLATSGADNQVILEGENMCVHACVTERVRGWQRSKCERVYVCDAGMLCESERATLLTLCLLALIPSLICSSSPLLTSPLLTTPDKPQPGVLLGPCAPTDYCSVTLSPSHSYYIIVFYSVVCCFVSSTLPTNTTPPPHQVCCWDLALERDPEEEAALAPEGNAMLQV